MARKVHTSVTSGRVDPGGRPPQQFLPSCARAHAPVCAGVRSSVDITVDLNLDGNSLLLSLAIGSVGFVCFAYGKKQQRFPQMIAGLLLCVYPYFVSNLMLMSVIAVAILVLLGVAVRLGA
jgi:hypothetical protein